MAPQAGVHPGHRVFLEGVEKKQESYGALESQEGNLPMWVFLTEKSVSEKTTLYVGTL